MKKYTLYIALVLMLWTTLCFAQSNEYISGKVVDADQREPIPFASIRIKDRALGVISNIDGSFKIPAAYKSMGEILEISCIGYTTKELKIDDLPENQNNVILLKPSTLELSEVVVSAGIKKLRPKEIVRIAINGIPQNYPLESFALVGYYRDYQIKNREYTNLNEALIKILDDGFIKKDNFNNKYKVLSYKQNEAFKIDSLAMMPYDYTGQNKVVPGATLFSGGGNEFILLSIHDAIRNYGKESFSFVDNLETDFLERHTFRLKRITSYNSREVYEIDLVYRDDTYLANGTIYIFKDDFAIHKLDYSLNKRKKPGLQSIAVNEEERYSNGFAKTENELLYHIVTEYSRGANNKMYLNYISFYNKMLIKRPAVFTSRFSIDLNENSFKIIVNNAPWSAEQVKSKDFIIRYKNEQIPIKSVTYLEELRTFVVYPNLNDNTKSQLYKELFMPSKTMSISNLEYEFHSIKDFMGNALDEQKLEFMHQYREFFTQQVSPSEKTVFSDHSIFMIKTAPLNSPDQPVFEGEITHEYWMNTPLLGIEP